MRIAILTLFLCAAGTLPALADDFAACRSIKDSLARLTCYDAAADKSAPIDNATSPPPPPPPPPRNTQSKDVVSLASWEYSSKKGVFGDLYFIKYTLHNNSDKSIKLIDGSLRFSDLLGESVYGIKLDKDVIIKPGSDASFSGNYNRFGLNADRLARMSKSDVAAALEIRAIIFVDNSVVRFGE
jgi:hypothetical protein